MPRTLFVSAAAAALLLATGAAHAAEFRVGAGPGPSNGIGGDCTPGAHNSVQATPAHVGPITCSSFLGVGSAAGTASFGHVGASADATTLTGSSLPSVFGGNGDAVVPVIFTSTDPTATAATVSANLIIEGTLNASGTPGFSAADAQIQGDFSLGGGGFFQFDYRIFSSGLFQAGNAMIQTGGHAGVGAFNASFVTPNMVIPLNTVLFIQMGLQADAEGSGAGASATADFDNTFKFPTGTDAFNLPDGVTVNGVDGGWLVNDRFFDPLAPSGDDGAPEPAEWTLLLAGFGLAGAALRRSKSLPFRGGWRA